jgi:hypothetical protein
MKFKVNEVIINLSFILSILLPSETEGLYVTMDKDRWLK